jgi:hypothetical protein
MLLPAMMAKVLLETPDVAQDQTIAIKLLK